MKCLSTWQYIRADGVGGYLIWTGQCPGAARRPGVHDSHVILSARRRAASSAQLLYEYNTVSKLVHNIY